MRKRGAPEPPPQAKRVRNPSGHSSRPDHPLPIFSTLLPNQGGFRQGRNCAEQATALRLVIEACAKYQDTAAVMIFVDFKRPFDSLDRVFLVNALHSYVAPAYLIRAAMASYLGATITIRSRTEKAKSFHLTKS